MRNLDLNHDYSTLETWWKIHQWPPVPRELLPPTGLIVEGKAAGFIYLTETPIAWLEWVVGNPLCDKIERGQAVDQVIDGLLQLARERGKTMVFSSVNKKSLEARYEKAGAMKGDSNMTNYIWRF